MRDDDLFAGLCVPRAEPLLRQRAVAAARRAARAQERSLPARAWTWLRPELAWAAPLLLLVVLHGFFWDPSPSQQQAVGAGTISSDANVDSELVALGLANARAFEARHDDDANGRERRLIERELLAL